MKPHGTDSLLKRFFLLFRMSKNQHNTKYCHNRKKLSYRCLKTNRPRGETSQECEIFFSDQREDYRCHMELFHFWNGFWLLQGDFLHLHLHRLAQSKNSQIFVIFLFKKNTFLIKQAEPKVSRSFHGKSTHNKYFKYLFCLKTRLNQYMAKSLAKKIKNLLQADLSCKYSQFPLATLWDQNAKFIFQQNKFYPNFGEIGLASTFGHCTFWARNLVWPYGSKKNPK